ncbi:MAG: GNAT family N-acetyltransferase [Oscillospiraceae bacterium]
MIVEVTENNLCYAASIHSVAWKSAHEHLCSPEFIKEHSVQNQEEYLREEREKGKKIYMLIGNIPIGIVSVWGNLIENLYVLPFEQRKGYGTALLRFALDKCQGTPTLWALQGNVGAYNLYSKFGFRKTGNTQRLSETVVEIEMEQKL